MEYRIFSKKKQISRLFAKIFNFFHFFGQKLTILASLGQTIAKCVSVYMFQL